MRGSVVDDCRPPVMDEGVVSLPNRRPTKTASV